MYYDIAQCIIAIKMKSNSPLKRTKNGYLSITRRIATIYYYKKVKIKIVVFEDS